MRSGRADTSAGQLVADVEGLHRVVLHEDGIAERAGGRAGRAGHVDGVGIGAHAHRLASPFLRAAFAPLVLRTAPPAASIARLASIAGWRQIAIDADPVQPVYRMRLS